MTVNEPVSPSAAPTSWTTGVAWKSPVVSPSPGSEPPVAGGQKIAFPGDNDAGGRDDVAASVAQAVSNATDRQRELQGDTFGVGSRIGDALVLPAVPGATSKHTGPV
jgi:hypothetical protein